MHAGASGGTATGPGRGGDRALGLPVDMLPLNGPDCQPRDVTYRGLAGRPCMKVPSRARPQLHALVSESAEPAQATRVAGSGPVARIF